MEDTTVKILCAGDLHLGRHPTRIPDELDGPECSPRSVWQQKIVRDAIERDVDAVVLTGDIADRENRYFEAYGAFEAGVIELADAGIPIIAVAGNHDAEFLPRMVDDIELDNLHLLGRNGTWERWEFEHNGTTVAYFDGWSFPSQHVSTSPLQDYDLSDEVDVPQIGVLHAELDSPDSQYAPIQSTELRDTPATCWLLGHIHAPGVRIESDPLTLYAGSPQALDPGEPGVHGSWLVTVRDDGRVETEQLPAGTVCYDEIKVDVGDVEDIHGVTAKVSKEIQHHFEENLITRNMQTFLPRVQLTGRTPAHSQLVERQSELETQLATKYETVNIRLESIRVDTRPAVDLDSLATGDGPVAYLAELLLTLENGEHDSEYTQLLDSAQERMQEGYRAPAYDLIRKERNLDDPNRDEVIDQVTQEARLLLDTLLQQKEGQ
ncbi:MAG: DNA repair exonuclease [Halobacteriales archaeon]|nr:DNA repair exonuclease [Halobacteriales archaeon]